MANRHNLIQNPTTKKRDLHQLPSIMTSANASASMSAAATPSNTNPFAHSFQHQMTSGRMPTLVDNINFTKPLPVGIPVGKPQTVKIPSNCQPVITEIKTEEPEVPQQLPVDMERRIKEEEIIKIESVEAESTQKSNFSDFERDRYA